jgi:hypothetical protein
MPLGALAAIVGFAIYANPRIFVTFETWASPNEPRTFLDKDETGTFDITLFPDHRFLSRSRYQNGVCVKAGEVHGTTGRQVLGRLHYVDCPYLIKFHFPPDGIEMACIDMKTISEEGKGCALPDGLTKQTVFHRLMGFPKDGSGLYDTGSYLRRVYDPDINSLYATLDRLAPLVGQKTKWTKSNGSR